VEALSEAGGVPDGLVACFTRDDVVPSIPALRAVLLETPNAGLALRQANTLHSIERYQTLQKNTTDRVDKDWVVRMQAPMEGFYLAAELLEVGLLREHVRGYRVRRVNTIISHLWCGPQGRGVDCSASAGSNSLRSLQWGYLP